MLMSAGLVAMNALQVGNFGEFEYWFALIKVLAIVIFIAVGLLLITGLGPWPAVGLANLTHHGGFLPHGWRGVWLALTLAITSYKCEHQWQPVCASVRNGGNSVCRRNHELGRHYGSAFKCEHEPVPLDSNVVLTITWKICSGMAGPSEYQWSSASRAGSLQCRYDCRDSAGRFCAEKCFPAPLRNRRVRHVLRLGCDPDHPFAISPENRFGDTVYAPS